MSDVARLAGVSISTVSRALGGSDLISPAVRQRVRDSAKQLGFQRSTIAGSLKSSKTPLVAVIVPTLINAFFAGTVQSMSRILAAADYQLLLAHHDYDLEEEARLIANCLGWSPSALVVTGLHHTPQAMRLLLEAECPVVEMWDFDDRGVDSVIGFDNTAAGTMAAEHLIAQGCRRLCYCGAELDRDPRGAARMRGFVEATIRAGLAPPAIHHAADRTVGAGCAALPAIIAEDRQTDGIAFSSDALALGALFESTRAGIRVPDDLALIGYGDLENAEHAAPSISTISPPREAIGETVALHLLDRLAGRAEPALKKDLGVRLIARESTNRLQLRLPPRSETAAGEQPSQGAT